MRSQLSLVFVMLSLVLGGFVSAGTPRPDVSPAAGTDWIADPSDNICEPARRAA